MEIQHGSAISNWMAKEVKYISVHIYRQPVHKRMNKFQYRYIST